MANHAVAQPGWFALRSGLQSWAFTASLKIMTRDPDCPGISAEEHLRKRYLMIRFDAEPPEMRRMLRIARTRVGASRLLAYADQSDYELERVAAVIERDIA